MPPWGQWKLARLLSAHVVWTFTLVCTPTSAKHLTESLILEEGVYGSTIWVECAAFAGPHALNNQEGCINFLYYSIQPFVEALKMFAKGDLAPPADHYYSRYHEVDGSAWKVHQLFWSVWSSDAYICRPSITGIHITFQGITFSGMQLRTFSTNFSCCSQVVRLVTIVSHWLSFIRLGFYKPEGCEVLPLQLMKL